MKKLILILLCINIGVFYLIFDFSKRGSLVSFFDVGEGSSVLIYNPRFKILYDTGPYGFNTISEINKILPFYDRRIDFLIISHPDKDHYGGAFDILDRFKIRIVFITPLNSQDSGYLQLLKYIKDKNIPIITLEKGDFIESNYEKIFVLNPEPNIFNKDNENSIVLKINKDNRSYLLTGDIDKKAEEYLIKRFKDFLDVDYLLIPHHGSKYSLDEKFLKITSPILAIIQVGKNKYGHPNKEVIELLKSFKIKYWRTDLNKALIIK
ncbi:MAG: ComEC/Rec2 family competence protein [Minisyncoccia bacterium]